jgi:hypothetical protein
MLAMGCEHVNYYVSAPEALPAGAAGKVYESGLAEFRLNDLKVRVTALDSTVTGGLGWLNLAAVGLPPIPHKYKADPTPIPPLMMQFELEPAKLGFSFNPMRVGVKASGGDVLLPLSYVGPGELRFDETKRGLRCLDPKGRGLLGLGIQQLSKRTDATDVPLPAKRTCFVVAFDIRVLPPNTVELSINGIALGVQPVPLPSLRLSRRKAKSSFIDLMPPTLP